MAAVSRKCRPAFGKAGKPNRRLAATWRSHRERQWPEFLASCSRNGSVDGCAPGVRHPRLLQEQRLHQHRPAALQEAVQHLPNAAHECHQVLAAALREHRILARRLLC